MRILIAGLLLSVVLAAPAYADVYGLSITMPSPGGNTAQCKPYLNGTALAPKGCGTQAYPGVVPTEGSYAVTYAAVSSKGAESGQSPATAVVIDQKPPTPTAGPTVAITCPVGSNAIITVNGVTVPCG